MTDEQKLDVLRKMADKPKPPSLKKALHELSDLSARDDMTSQLRAAVEARRDAVRMRAMAGASEGIC